MSVIVDGLGQTGTKIYASVGALPAARLGAMVSVDDGTTGRWFVGLSVSGVATWVELADLLNVVQTVATPTNNAITSSDPTATGLSINTAGPALTLVSPETLLLAIQSGTGPTQVPVAVGRATSTPSIALLETEPDGSTVVPFVNGSGEITVRTYAALPTASADHLGAIVRLLGGTGVQDTFWLCVLNSSGVPIWTQFIGATGATGATGAAGVTPELRESGGYIQVSYDGGVTWSNLVPLSDITGPAGPSGSPQYPALPDPGTSAVTFWITVLATGQYLPWLIPSGYTIQVTGSSGLWGAVQFGSSDFISDGLGNNDGQTWPTAHDGRFALGRIVCQFFDSTGALYAPDGTHNFSDPWTVLTIAEDTYLAFLENISTGSLAAELQALVTVTPPSATSWGHSFDFATSDGGWSGYTNDGTTVPEAVYSSGVGWIPNTALADTVAYPCFAALHNTTLTHFDADLVITGSASSLDEEIWIQHATGGSGHVVLQAQTLANGTTSCHLTWDGSQSVTAGEFFLILGQALFGSTPRVTVVHANLTGVGTDPFV